MIVNGVNTATKHQKARRANEQGGIIDRDMPVDASNVMLVHKGKPTRVGYKIAGRRHQGPRRQAHRRGDRMSDSNGRPPRRTDAAPQAEVQRRGQGRAQGAARARQRHAGAEAREDRHQHGRRPGHPAAVAARGRGRRPHRDHRPEADRHQGQGTRSPASSSARASRSAARSRCAATACGSSSTG